MTRLGTILGTAVLAASAFLGGLSVGRMAVAPPRSVADAPVVSETAIAAVHAPGEQRITTLEAAYREQRLRMQRCLALLEDHAALDHAYRASLAREGLTARTSHEAAR